MSFAVNSAFLGLHTARLSNAQFAVQQANEARLGLANTGAMQVAFGGGNPYANGSMQALAAADLQHTLSAQRNAIMAKATQAMIDSTKKMIDENIKRTFSTFNTTA